MKKKRTISIFPLIIFVTGILFIPEVLIAQDHNLAKDTLSKEPEIIKISEISLQSNQIIAQTNQNFNSLISDREIEQTGRRNDSVISVVDSTLNMDKTSNLDNNNIRQLKNKMAYWKQTLELIKQEEVAISSHIQKIDKEKAILLQEHAKWQNTLNAITDQDSYANVIIRINEVIRFLKDMGSKMDNKSEKLLVMLDKTANTEFAIDEFVEEIEQTQIRQESQIFARHHRSLLELDWGEWSNWNPIPSSKQYYKEEINLLAAYFRHQITGIITFIISMFILFLAFRSLKKHIIEKGISDHSFYGKELGKVFKQSIILAFILGIFLSVLIFPNRPVILTDISRILIVFPLIYIIFFLLNKKFSRHLILFGILTILISAIYIFPPEHLLYRILILLIATIEIGLLWSLLKYLNKNPLKNKLLNQFVRFILIVNLIISISGLVGAITGATMLAEEAVSVPVVITFAAMLLIVSVISVGGLIEIAIDSPRGKKSNVIRLEGTFIKTRIIRWLNIAAGIYWISIFLKSINLSQVIFDSITNTIKYEINIGSANFTLGEVLVFILVIWISVMISRFMQIVLEKDVLNRFKMAKGVPFTIGLMVRYAIITIGVFLAVSAAGLPVGSLGLLIGAFGVGIGFGLQNIFNNLVSGLILLFERPIQLGDTVEVGNLIGKVKSIGIRSSNVRTFEGAEVIVPNGLFISNEVVNWTLSDRHRRIEVNAGVAYGSDPHKVKKILLEGLKKHPDIIDDPAPEVFFKALGESSLDFRILFWTSNISEWLRIQSDIVFMVHDVLKENGIEIPFPQRDLHIKPITSATNMISKDK